VTRKTQKSRRKKPSRWHVWRWVLLVGAIVAGALLWMVWPFWQLAGQFGTQPEVQPSRLYGHSATLAPGQALRAEELAGLLDEVHYRSAASAMRPGTYHQDGGRFEIRRRRFPTPGGETGGDTLVVVLRGGRVAELTAGGQAVSRALLDPPLVASYYSPELRERRPVGLDELPEDLILSVLAAEDATFLDHPGVSLTGTLRALWVNLQAKEVRQGGSTLTQQLVKNIFLTPERTVTRKVQEALLALLLEWRFDKRAILGAYLNEIYWGRSGSVDLMGVGAAAWAYFGKEVEELDLAESALLAGIIQAPATYSPLHHPERALERRKIVLERLDRLRWVERSRLEAANARPLGVRRHALVARQAPYFADAMAAEAERRFGIAELRDTGHVLFSTLSIHDQEEAEAAVGWGVEALEKGWEKGRNMRGPLQAALVSIEPTTGAVRAYVGGRDYATSQFDRLALARRQAGSAFKPIVYAAAFDARLATPATLLEDAPFEWRLAGRTWSPSNSDGNYHGWVSARTALEKSFNVPTARLALRVGLGRVVELAHGLGIEGHLDPYPALALGAMEVTPLELATVYATLAAGGSRPSVHGLEAVFDRKGERVAGQPVAPPQPVLSPEVSYLVTRVLQGVLDRGTGRGAREQGIEDPLAGKTGTTNERRDSWFAGYSPERATLVWVGYDDASTTRLSGARAALPIWARFTFTVRPKDGFSDFEKPEGVVDALIDPATGGLATTACPEVVREVFLYDETPVRLCSEHRGWRAIPLEQPDQGVDEPRTHPFKRWLNKVVGKKKRSI